jgi:hypothetical protein
MGRLLSQASSEGGTGIRVGTLMIGDTPPTPGYFFYGFPVLQIPSLTQQIHALNGRLTARGTEPGDLRYIQSVEPIALNDGAETTLWVAVIAGEGGAEFERNADAAAEDIGERRRNQRQDLLADEGAYMTPGIARASSRPSCGKECVLQLKDRRPLRPMLQNR